MIKDYVRRRAKDPHLLWYKYVQLLLREKVKNCFRDHLLRFWWYMTSLSYFMLYSVRTVAFLLVPALWSFAPRFFGWLWCEAGLGRVPLVCAPKLDTSDGDWIV